MSVREGARRNRTGATDEPGGVLVRQAQGVKFQQSWKKRYHCLELPNTIRIREAADLAAVPGSCTIMAEVVTGATARARPSGCSEMRHRAVR